MVVDLFVFIVFSICITVGIVAASATPPGPDRFVYVIYYADDECIHRPVSAIGVTTDEVNPVFGGRSEEGICAQETLCFHNVHSVQCQEEIERTKQGKSFFHVDDDGSIIECDTTNENDQDEGDDTTGTNNNNNDEPTTPESNDKCSYVEDVCTPSSIYPHCQFRVVTSKTLFDDPDIIKNNVMEKSLDQLTYMAFYSDSECTMIEGIDGIVAGDQDMSITYGSHSCQDALRCLFRPEGAFCNDNVDDLSRTTYQVSSHTRNNGTDVYSCDDDGYCVPATSECSPSPIPSCYYRWVSALDLFANPSAFLKRAAVQPATAEVMKDDSGASTALFSFIIPLSLAAMSILSFMMIA